MANPEHLTSEGLLHAEDSLFLERRKQAGIGEKLPRMGVALSGGGIRSATFNLGILQELTKLGLLPYVDYLSTVSGGGYIGTWLHGVIKNKAKGNPRGAAIYLGPPEEQPHNRDNPSEDPIAFLRKYASYLAPEVGLFSADFWLIVVIWLRNTFLNQMILVPLLASLSFLVFALGLGWHGSSKVLSSGPLATAGLGSLLIAVVISTLFLGSELRHAADPECSPREGVKAETKLAMAVALAIFVTGACFSLSYPWMQSTGLLNPAIAWAVATAVYLLFQGLCGLAWYRPSQIFFAVGGGLATASFFLALATWMRAWEGNWDHHESWVTLSFGPPLGALALLFGIGVHLGLLGRDFPDYAREWLARVASFVVLLALAWAGVFALMIFSPWWVMCLSLTYGKTALGLLGSWIGITSSGVLAGKSPATGTQKSGESESVTKAPKLELISKIAPAVFVAGLLVLVAFGAFWVVWEWGVPLAVHDVGLAVHDVGSSVPTWMRWMEPMEARYWDALENTGNLVAELGALAAAAALMVTLAWRVNINEFSLQRFYGNRLIRCYLGASRGSQRKPNPFTGFDPHDELPISDLSPPEYFGPYPIVNSTVNMTRGSELAKQERKGESFIFTPKYCGFDTAGMTSLDCGLKEGFRDTARFMGAEKGPGIGLCTGISGAAASPNGGYHSSPPVAFLLTMFDVRLGWWVGNTRLDEPSEKRGPSFALRPLINELLAQTKPDANWLNLSDGGHFENLGIYELVRRRCKFIIAGDGEQDPDYHFESLGGVIRKCRTDFGVEIEIDPSRIIPKDSSPGQVHCAVGTIRYPGDGCEGKLLYLKSSLTGDEPTDITQFKSVHPTFPQETTANQFFTESQFESYRKLGRHVAASAFEFAARTKDSKLKGQLDLSPSDPITKLIKDLDERWAPPITGVSPGLASRHADTYTVLMNKLQATAALRELGPQLLDWPQGAVHKQDPRTYDLNKDEDKAIFFFMLEVIQLMENVWADLGLDQTSRRAGPYHSGWMGVFWRWKEAPAFKWAFGLARNDYSKLFCYFLDNLIVPPKPDPTSTCRSLSNINGPA